MQRVFIKVMLTKLLGSFASEDADVIGNIAMVVAIPVTRANSTLLITPLFSELERMFPTPLLLKHI